MTFGWRWEGSVTSSVLSIKDTDLFNLIAIPKQSYTALMADMYSAFSSVRLRKIEVWGLDGENIQLTPTTLTAVSGFALAPEVCKTDMGTVALSSYVAWAPRKGDMLDMWLTAFSGNQLFTVVANDNNSGSGGNGQIHCCIRIHVEFILNDNSAATVFTTSANNTVTGGTMYWRDLKDNVGLLLVPEAATLISSYQP